MPGQLPSLLLSCLLLSGVALGQTAKSGSAARSAKAKQASTTAKRAARGSTRAASEPAAKSPNLATTPTLYVVGYAHLDTEWRWEYPQVIQEYLTKTMRNNFALFEKYPHYIFNFTGANRYRLMKEYYPSDFERVEAVRGCRSLVSGRIVDGRRRREFSKCGVDHSADPLRQQLVSQRVRRGQRRIHAARLFWFPGFPAQHPGALGNQRLLHAKTIISLAAGAARGRSRLAGENAGWHPLQRRRSGKARMASTVIAALNPIELRQPGDLRHQQISATAARPIRVSSPQLNLARDRRQEDWPSRIQINGELNRHLC